MGTLFDTEITKDESPIQDLDITTLILYLSTTELKEFKHLCKEGMKKMLPETYRDEGNVPDLLLKLLREYANN